MTLPKSIEVPGAAHADPSGVLSDYLIAYLSRQMSLVARREVHAGRAKFGAFGGGKEVAQVALARAFRPGDWRAGYYRDQTWMLAAGLLTPQAYFAAIYAHADRVAEPATGGRSMLGHYGGRLLDDRGCWLPQTDRPNSSADVSPTGGQMPRLVGLGHASRLFRELEPLHSMTDFSIGGNEVAFGTIGNASCAEGLFWESVNAIGVLRAPVVLSIWDDGYGISVPNEDQIMGGDLSQLLEGFALPDNPHSGFQLHRVPGWDYPALISVYEGAAAQARAHHVPAIVHVIEMTQPQGHSTSGSHERYKSPERLAWEAEHDPVSRMRQWMIEEGVADRSQVGAMETEIEAQVRQHRDDAWGAYVEQPRREAIELAGILENASGHNDELAALADELRRNPAPLRKQMVEAARAALMTLPPDQSARRRRVSAWKTQILDEGRRTLAEHLISSSDESPLNVPVVQPELDGTNELVRGFELLNVNFDAVLSRDPRVVIFGEDVGRLGGVNASLTGLQTKYGLLRVSDTGIREASLIGQAIGLALRGLRPIVEIQYLDYILYALTTLSDDLAMLRWRTAGGQKAPVIVRTRGHRLEGIWHAGSPMGALLPLLRGMHVLVPRDMTRAAGFYNTLLRGDDPALVVEVLNGYRIREPLPLNPGDFTVPLGQPEILREGKDITLVTYGACCRIAQAAAELLETAEIDIEIIDVQSLLPFDLNHRIVESVRKTSRLVVLDEDVPGGASAFIMQQVVETQGAFGWLDAPPMTITAQDHRPAYGTDGDYFSKPNVEDVFTRLYAVMHEAEPHKYPLV